MRRGAAGFTVLELLTTVTVMAILVAIAIPGFGYLAASTKVKAASTELYLAMIRARSESVKRNRSVAIVKTGADWQGGWQIIADGTDADSDYDNVGTGVDDDRLIYTQDELKRVTITMADDRVVFRPNGRISEPAPPASPAFDVSAPDQDSGSNLLRCVTADITGRPYIRQEECP